MRKRRNCDWILVNAAPTLVEIVSVCLVTVFPAAPPPSARISSAGGFRTEPSLWGLQVLIALKKLSFFFFDETHAGQQLPASCPSVFFLFFFLPPSRAFLYFHNLCYMAWFSVRGPVLLWGFAGAHPAFHHLSWAPNQSVQHQEDTHTHTQHRAVQRV